MAFQDSITLNGKSIRDFFTEITEVKGRGQPNVRRQTVKILGRHGEANFGQEYQPRIFEINGTIEGASHATLMDNISELKNLFAMNDQLLTSGEQTIADGAEHGKLIFGDESDRYYKAIYDGVMLVPEISHRWFQNDLKRVRMRLRADDPFAYATTLSEVTMGGSADEFKVFDTGTARSESIIEIEGAVTNPVLIEGDKVAVAHFDYSDDLTDVEVNTVSGNFAALFGYRTRKALTGQQSKAIQIVSKDNLFFDRGTNIDGDNYDNFNPYQGTLIFWVRPNWDGNDGLSHFIMDTEFNTNNFIQVLKSASNKIFLAIKFNGTTRNASITLDSDDMPAGTWQMIAGRWSVNNTIDDSANYVQIDLIGNTEGGNTSALDAVQSQDQFISIGQSYGTTPDGSTEIFDGLIYHHFMERALSDAELDDLFNSGAGVEPFVTPDTKLLSAGALDGSDLPTAIRYPYRTGNLIENGNQEDSPIAGWMDDDAGITQAIETGTVKYDLQSTKVEYASVDDGKLAWMEFTATNGLDYFYRFWINVDSLDISSDLELIIDGGGGILTRQLNTGTDDMGVSYAEDTWLYFEGTITADDSTIRVGFRVNGAGAGANNAVFYVDQLDVQRSLAENGGMEGTYVGGIAENWNTNGSGSTRTEENVIVHSGGASQKIVQADSSQGGIQGATEGVTFDADSYIAVSIWAKGEGAGEQVQMLFSNLTGEAPTSIRLPLTSEWAKYTGIFKITSDTSGTAVIQIINPGTGASRTCYLDDYSIITLETVSANAASEPTKEIDSYSQERFNQGLKIDGGDTLSWAVTGNKNEGAIIAFLKPQFDAGWEDSTDDPIIYELVNNTTNLLRLSYDWTNDQWNFTKLSTAGGTDIAISQVQTFEKNQALVIIGTWGANGVKIYVDSVIGGTSPADTNALAGNPDTLYMSNNGQTIFPDSVIDELVVLSREIDAQEAKKFTNKIENAIKNDNAKMSMTKVLAVNDKLVFDSENEVINFVDSSAGNVTNAIASMDAGSLFAKLDPNKSVIYSKVASSGIKMDYRKKYL